MITALIIKRDVPVNPVVRLFEKFKVVHLKTLAFQNAVEGLNMGIIVR
ncbi:MAG: hypothetical protein K0Q56_2665 [Sporolactobacillus laevolacticus]|nr:hypothetical protein [Sporolactobacillus laevolacticus]